MVRSSSSDISPKEIKETLLRHKKKVFAIFAALFSLSILFVLLDDPKYCYEAKLFLRLGRENVVLDPTATTASSPAVTMPYTREDELNSTVDLITSRVLIESLVDELSPEYVLTHGKKKSDHPIVQRLRQIKNAIDPSPKLSEREIAIRTVLKQLEVSAVKHSTVISISYTDESPEVSLKVVQTLIALYQREHIRINRAPGAYDFLLAQTENAKKQLEETEGRWRELKVDTGVVDVVAQKTLLVTSLDALELELKRVRIEQTTSAASIKSLEQLLETIPAMREISKTDGQLAAGADSMKDTLYQLEVREKELSARYTEEHFLVRNIRKQVQEARELYDSHPANRTESITATNPVHGDLEIKLAQEKNLFNSQHARIEALKEQIGSTQKEIERMSEVELKFVELQRLVELQNANYRKYSENLEQARIDHQLDLQRISSINVIESKTAPSDPVDSYPFVKLAIGCVASLMAAIAVAFVAERWRKSFLDQDHFEHSGIMPDSSSANY